MNESRAVALIVDAFEIDNKLIRVVLGERENLRAEEAEDVVRDNIVRFVMKVGIVDTEVRIKPVNFIDNELARHEALDRFQLSARSRHALVIWDRPWRPPLFEPLHAVPPCLIPNIRSPSRTEVGQHTLENRCRIARQILDAMHRSLAARP